MRERNHNLGTVDVDLCCFGVIWTGMLDSSESRYALPTDSGPLNGVHSSSKLVMFALDPHIENLFMVGAILSGALQTLNLLVVESAADGVLQLLS